MAAIRGLNIKPLASYNTPGAGKPANSRGGVNSLYDAAATTQAQDYDDIMAGYDSLQKRAASGVNNFTPLNAVSTKYLPNYSYKRTGDMGKLVGDLQNFSATGGYSDADIGNIRERGLSPLRAVYANAQRDVDRQKALQGGYSPNHGAVTAKMARELSELLSGQAGKINADVAQMVASGKLSGMQTLSPLLDRENALSNEISNRNVDARRENDIFNATDQQRVRDLNANMKMASNQQNSNNELGALQGKTNLYGTTPALTKTFGDQVLSNTQQQMNAITTANQIKNNRAGLQVSGPPKQPYSTSIMLGRG